jgi:hypothetical protein
MTDDRDADVSSESFFIRGERASKSQRLAEDLEIVGGHGGHQRAPRPLANVQTCEDRGIGRQVREDIGRAFAEIEVARVGEAPILS